MKKLYRIWTLQIAHWRKAAELGIPTLDITAKSGEKCFAPLMQNVMLHKDKKMSDDQYMDAYVRKMRDSRRDHPKVWQQLENEQEIAVMCYCQAGAFCHRHPFVKMMKTYLEERGHEVIIEGELTRRKPESIRTPASIVSAPKEKPEVIGFFGWEDLLSNWHPKGFTVKGKYFPHGECFMMYCKAMLFGDHKKAEEILNEPSAAVCKELGKEVTPYDDDVWNAKGKGYLVTGCLAKARQWPEVRDYLLSTKGKILAEVSRSDRKWGIGLSEDDPRVQDPTQWRGENQLGEVWMAVRGILEAEVEF